MKSLLLLGCLFVCVCVGRFSLGKQGNEFIAAPSLSQLGIHSGLTTTGPVISSEYKAKGSVESLTSASEQTYPTPATFAYSARYSASKQEIRSYLPYFPQKEENGKKHHKNEDQDSFLDSFSLPSGYKNASWEPLNDIVIQNSQKEFVILNNVCRTAPLSYNDPLAIAPYTTFTYSTTVWGIPSDVYTLNSSSWNITLYVEQANNSIPLKYEVTSKTSTTIYSYRLFISDVTFDPDYFDIPDVCTPPGVICEGEGIQPLEVLRFHAPNDFDLGDQNAADTLGVTSFICVSVLENAEPGYAWISTFNMTVDTAYGNYGLCNLHYCWTLNPNAVGRETSFGVTPNGGQCAPDDPMFGEWYSFTSVSECPEGVPVSPENNCSWKTDQRIKTVGLDCLKDLGMMDHCRADLGFPFPTATKTLERGFEVCPDPSNNNFL